MVQNMQRVDRLILFNTLVYPDFSWGVKLFVLATLLPGVKHWLSSPSGVKWAIQFGIHQKDKITDEAIKQYQAPFIDKNARKALLKSIHRLSPRGYQEIADKIVDYQGPVQLLYGQEDRILPKVATTMQRVKEDLPQAQLKAFPNCGHFLQEEIPQELSAVVLAFMES